MAAGASTPSPGSSPRNRASTRSWSPPDRTRSREEPRVRIAGEAAALDIRRDRRRRPAPIGRARGDRARRRRSPPASPTRSARPGSARSARSCRRRTDRVVEGVLPRGGRGGRRRDGRAASFDGSGARHANMRRREAAPGDGVVVKADGLAAGKGVVVAESADEAVAAIEALVRAGVERIVVEERLRGPEASVIAICDGERRPGPAGRTRPQAACSTATSGRTPAGWAPTRRSPTCPTTRSRRSSRPFTGRCWRSSPGAGRRSGASSTPA